MMEEGECIGGSYVDFINVWLPAVGQSSLTLVLLLTTELCTLHIHPPVRVAGSLWVRETWPLSGLKQGFEGSDLTNPNNVNMAIKVALFLEQDK